MMTITYERNNDSVHSNNEDFLCEWNEGEYRLSMWVVATEPSFFGNRSTIAYRFWHSGVLVFSGEDFRPSPVHSIDGTESVAALLSFLALQPGDTDSEYFDSYTPEQLEFADQHGEDLSMLVMELEESAEIA